MDSHRLDPAPADLRSGTLARQPERASLGVFADRPCLPRVNHAPAQRLDPLQRLGDIGYGEVGQREGIAGSASARMDADRRRARMRLPALSLFSLASLHLNAEESHPETTGALGVVRGKLGE
jgi:hypothetical protein